MAEVALIKNGVVINAIVAGPDYTPEDGVSAVTIPPDTIIRIGETTYSNGQFSAPALPEGDINLMCDRWRIDRLREVYITDEKRVSATEYLSFLNSKKIGADLVAADQTDWDALVAGQQWQQAMLDKQKQIVDAGDRQSAATGNIDWPPPPQGLTPLVAQC